MDIAGLLVLLDRGGIIIWAIGLLSLVAATLIIWKVLRLVRSGAWGGSAARNAVQAFREAGKRPHGKVGGLRYQAVRHAIDSVTNSRFTEAQAREDTERFARTMLNEARSGLRGLESIATVAPLLGLLGTVLGMIEAFQALQSSGARADPSVLAGGIWEALLTTAAGMAVAIPVALALAWFEGVIDSIAADIEDLVTQVFLASPAPIAQAAE
ncbi:MAG: MotA/TolQ/ExbB proton channel family protein [Woeseia sp.]|nr:MotA/TolQ/ExbB proton channel family protein [Woeseia sp.]